MEIYLGAEQDSVPGRLVAARVFLTVWNRGPMRAQYRKGRFADFGWPIAYTACVAHELMAE